LIRALVLLALILPASYLSAVTPQDVSTFRERCAVCHGADGVGVPGIYPRLRSRVVGIASTAAGRDYLTQVILFGLAGPITVDGVGINGFMPAFADLSDEQVTVLMHYLIEGLQPSDAAGLVAATDVARLRLAKQTPSALYRLRRDIVTEATESSPTNGSPTGRLSGAHEDYVRACQGCHGEDGCTNAAVVPPLKSAVGYFTRSPEGRSYLVEVPGVAFSALDDERLARLLNWVLLTMSPQELAPDFIPYQAGEVGRLRANALVEVTITRTRIFEKLANTSDPRTAHGGGRLSKCDPSGSARPSSASINF
jgi:mono/diheme cytochrome c family protein